MLIRGVYDDGWRLRDKPLPKRTKDEFLGHIEAASNQDPNEDTECLVREVFKLLQRKVSPGEIADMKHVLPPKMRELQSAARR